MNRRQTVLIGDIVVDAAIEETHTMQAKATEHPVESGSNIADHVQTQPTSLKIDGIISNTPMSMLGLPIFQSEDRADAAFKQFEELVSNGRIINIVTTLKTYKDMVIEDFVVTRTAVNAEALRFTCTAKQIAMVASKLISIQLPKMPRAQKKKSVGKQPAVKASEPVAQKAQSLISSLLGGT